MASIIHRSNTRGKAEIDWLKSRHTFSFADYYDPQRMGFGKLRVLNDDVVRPGRGFDTHLHRNMEIISIPLIGALEHKDSEGNEHIIETGEIQLMSAGSGISHSEYNHSDTESVNFLQIWVEPASTHTEPRYDQFSYKEKLGENRFSLVVSPQSRDFDGIKINQQAYFSLANFSSICEVIYRCYESKTGVYFFSISGKYRVHQDKIAARDGIGITLQSAISITSESEGLLLVMEVPL